MFFFSKWLLSIVIDPSTHAISLPVNKHQVLREFCACQVLQIHEWKLWNKMVDVKGSYLDLALRRFVSIIIIHYLYRCISYNISPWWNQNKAKPLQNATKCSDVLMLNKNQESSDTKQPTQSHNWSRKIQNFANPTGLAQVPTIQPPWPTTAGGKPMPVQGQHHWAVDPMETWRSR